MWASLVWERPKEKITLRSIFGWLREISFFTRSSLASIVYANNIYMLENANDINFVPGLFVMTERKLISPGKFHHDDRVICPTCRHATDFGNIAFADDEQDVKRHTYDKTEASITVQGSYSTKVYVTHNHLDWYQTCPSSLCLVWPCRWLSLLPLWVEYAKNLLLLYFLFCLVMSLKLIFLWQCITVFWRLKQWQGEFYGSALLIPMQSFLFFPVGMMSLMCYSMPLLPTT